MAQKGSSKLHPERILKTLQTITVWLKIAIQVIVILQLGLILAHLIMKLMFAVIPVS